MKPETSEVWVVGRAGEAATAAWRRAGWTVREVPGPTPDVAAWLGAGRPPLVVPIDATGMASALAGWAALRARRVRIPWLAWLAEDALAAAGRCVEAGAADLATTADPPDLVSARLGLLARRAREASLVEGGADAAEDRAAFVFELGTGRLLHFDSVGLAGLEDLGPGPVQTEGLRSRLHPEDLPRFGSRMERSLALVDGEVSVGSYRVRAPNGDYHWLYTRMVVMSRDATGRPLLTLGSVQDVTPRRAAEEALTALLHAVAPVGRGYFDAAVEALGSYVGATRTVLAEQDGDVLRVLAAWPADDGLPPGHPLPQSRILDAVVAGGVVEVAAPDGPVDEPLLAALGGRSALAVPVRLPDERVVGASIVVDRGPAAVGQVGLGIVLALAARAGAEIDRRRVEAELDLNRERLALVLAGAGTSPWDYDVEADRPELSPEWQRRVADLGVSAESTAALRTIVHPDDLPAVDAAVERHLAGETRAFEQELRIRALGGGWGWVLVRGAVLERAPGGGPRRVSGIVTDIDARKRMDERLRVADRLSTVGTLAAGVAHEINNPLAYVLGNLEYLLTATDPTVGPLAGDRLSQARRAVAEAIDGAERVRAIVADLKLFSVIDDDSRHRIDVMGVVDASLRMVQSQLRLRAGVERALMPVPRVLGSEGRLGQAVVSLLVNAAQAMPAGRPVHENRVRVALDTDVGGTVILTVEDNGVGMRPEVLRRIFDPFFTTRPVGEAMGLGLSMAHAIVTGMGGRIEVESRVGVGSTFRILLPSARGETRPTPLPALPTVLVVDDEPLIVSVIEGFLAGRYRVVGVATAREALARARGRDRIHAVIADLGLPGEDGAALYAELERLDPRLAARTGFTTGGATTAEALAFLERMAGRVLEKPFDRAALLALVDTLMDRA